MLRLHSEDEDVSADAQLARAREVLRVEAAALLSVADRLGEAFLRAVELLHSTAGLVVVCGMGKAGHIGQKVAATFASTGTRAFFLHPAEAVHGDLGRVSAGDVVVAFSHSGETAELTQILRPIRDANARIVGVTSRDSSTLARLSDVVIAYGPVEEACPIGMAPSTSCAVMLGVGDALAFALMRRRSFGHEDFGRFHPGGSLGRRLAAVEEVMRKGRQLRVASDAGTVRDVVIQSQRQGRRTGAIMLVGESGRLSGIFTDSDLVRMIERRDEKALERPIAEAMTTDPITLRAGQRVLEALELFRDFHVSEIPVLDDERRPIGLVDITDLVDLLPEAA